jgi:hypothetical protein
MSNFSQVLVLLLAVSLYPHPALSSENPQDGGITAITKSSDGRGVPFGSSTDKSFLPWLKPTDDPSYGYSMDKPIEIGGFLEGRGNDWPAQYFSSLLGPNGEPTTYERVKSCCAFAVTNPKIVEAGIKTGFLDQFKVTIDGQEPVYLFVTLYTEGKILAPKGFTVRK